MDFSKKLISWYLRNKRSMPWRETKDPYRIWLSEIILQQTRVAQGLPYYLAFVDAFPTVFDLADATEEQVSEMWIDAKALRVGAVPRRRFGGGPGHRR